jgi:hypothetical protein
MGIGLLETQGKTHTKEEYWTAFYASKGSKFKAREFTERLSVLEKLSYF